MKKKKEEEKKMAYSNQFDVAGARHRYFTDRLESIWMNLTNKAEKHYGLRDDNPPESFNELMDRLNSGKYVIPEDKKDKKTGFNSVYYIRWRDPAVKEDRDGFNAESEKIRAALNKAQDVIFAATSPESMLKAVEDFENYTIQ